MFYTNIPKSENLTNPQTNAPSHTPSLVWRIRTARSKPNAVEHRFRNHLIGDATRRTQNDARQYRLSTVFQVVPRPSFSDVGEFHNRYFLAFPISNTRIFIDFPVDARVRRRSCPGGAPGVEKDDAQVAVRALQDAPEGCQVSRIIEWAIKWILNK